MPDRTSPLLHRVARRIPAGLWFPASLMLLWIGIIDSGWQKNALLVPLHQLVLAPFIDEQGRQIWKALWTSIIRVITGFTIGSSIGIALGLATGMSRRVKTTFSPSLHTLRQIALFAWIPLLTAWFGNGDTVKVLFIAIAAFFPVFLNTERGVQIVPVALREVAQVLHLTRYQRIRYLIIPAALPSINTGLELAMLTAWIGTVGAEYAIGTGIGIGSYLAASREVFRMDLVLAGVIILAITGYGFSKAMHILLHRLESEKRHDNSYR